MKKVRSKMLMFSLVFFFTLVAAGCAQTGSNTMGGSGTETHMESMSDDTMDNNMNKTKTMDTMDAKKMDESMEKNMQNNMK